MRLVRWILCRILEGENLICGFLNVSPISYVIVLAERQYHIDDSSVSHFSLHKW